MTPIRTLLQLLAGRDVFGLSEIRARLDTLEARTDDLEQREAIISAYRQVANGGGKQ